MVEAICERCDGPLYWDWTEAFAKFGFGDGDGTGRGRVTEAGYTVTVEQWGLHNTVITSIKRDETELIPHDNPSYRLGYDDLRAFFPEELVTLIDEKLPPTQGWDYPW